MLFVNGQSGQFTNMFVTNISVSHAFGHLIRKEP